MPNRFDQFTPPRLPQLPASALRGLSPDLAQWLYGVERSLVEWGRMVNQTVKDIDRVPTAILALETTNQSVSANTETAVHFNTVVLDTHDWWDGTNYQYLPKERGFYLCSWHVRIGDSGAIAVGTSGYSKLHTASQEFSDIVYGNGTAAQLSTSGSALIECDGSATAIKVLGYLSAGTAPAFVAGTYPTWLTLTYVGRRDAL